MKQTPGARDSGTRGEACRISGRGIPVRAGRGWLDYEATLQEEKRVLVVDIGGGTTDCSLLLMGPQWRSRLDGEASLLGHSGCRIGGDDWTSHWRLKT